MKGKMKGKKYGTVDEIMTAGTGMDKKERADWRGDVKHWQKVRREAERGSAEFKEAEAEISRLMGW